MTMRRLAVVAWAFLACLPFCRADEFSDNFSANLTKSAMDALAKDMGALMAAGSVHTGDTLNFPIGFDVGFHAAGVQIKDENKILHDNKSFVPVGWLQAELGLPARFNVMARYGKLFNADLYGGGIRYGLLKSDVPGVPSISIAGLYHHAHHSLFDAHTYSANLALSFDVPIIHPYIAGGYDWTKLDPRDTAFSGVPSADRSITGSASGYRAEAGVNLSVVPFTYITLGGGLANGGKMGHAAFGIRF